MLIGIGDWDQVDQVIVQWPSGKKTIAHSVQEGEWLTLRERGGEERSSYRRQVVLNEGRLAGAWLFPLRLKSSARLTVWKGMATWCPACARYRAHFEQLKLKTEDLGVSFLAFPLDENEENETLKAYEQSNDLPYQLLSNLSDLDRKRALVFLQRWIGAAELPSPTSLVTNQRGEIVWVGAGAPTVSDLRRLLDEDS
jgi:thiol-disulfide isomerase/thioredoxin